MARRYEFMQQTSEILFLAREHEMHVFEPTSIMFLFITKEKTDRNESKAPEYVNSHSSAAEISYSFWSTFKKQSLNCLSHLKFFSSCLYFPAPK